MGFLLFELSASQGIVIISLNTRRIDTDSAPVIERELQPVIAQHPKGILFDLSKTEYISSAGVRVLLGSTRSMKESGGAVALCSICRQVMYVFEITGFAKIFTIYESREKALRHMKKNE